MSPSDSNDCVIIVLVTSRKEPESSIPDGNGAVVFGPRLRDEQVLHLKVDPRVGGKFSFLVRREGGEVDHIGTYCEIDRPERLAFTWVIAGASSDESVVSIDIKPLDFGCELTLTHDMDPKWADYAERTKTGWTKMIDMLADVLG
jgi:uncharacterized protein YndB with AHSA1/START domain